MPKSGKRRVPSQDPGKLPEPKPIGPEPANEPGAPKPQAREVWNSMKPEGPGQNNAMPGMESTEVKPAGKIRAWHLVVLVSAIIGLIGVYFYYTRKEPPPVETKPVAAPVKIRHLRYVKDIHLQVQSGGFQTVYPETIGCVQNEKCPDFRTSLNSNIFKVALPNVTGLFVVINLGGEEADKPVKIIVSGESAAEPQVYDFRDSDHYEFPIDYGTKADFLKIEIRDFKGNLLYDAGRCPAVKRIRTAAKIGDVDSFRLARYYIAFERACMMPPKKEAIPDKAKKNKSK